MIPAPESDLLTALNNDGSHAPLLVEHTSDSNLTLPRQPLGKITLHFVAREHGTRLLVVMVVSLKRKSAVVETVARLEQDPVGRM